MTGSMRIEVVDTAEGFAALRPEWDVLHTCADRASVFTCWDWQYRWWLVYGRQHRLQILVARDRERIVGLLPLHLCREQVAGPLRARVLRLVGTGGDTDPDDLGPVLDAGAQPEAAALLAAHVLSIRSTWDVLRLSDLEPGTLFVTELATAAFARGLRVVSGLSARIQYLELPPSWEVLLAGLSRDRRWRLRSRRRKLEERFRTRFFLWSDPATLDDAVDRLAALHRLRWRAAGQHHSFASDQYVDFHRSVIKAGLERGWLRLYCLELDGVVAAMYYCYRFRDRVFLMQGGFDPALAEWNLGHVLLGFALEHAITEGNVVFDFLRGEHRYKSEWSTGVRETVSLTLWRHTPASVAMRLCDSWWPGLRRRLRAMVVRA
jgi:CelD/BcsL family acetyltransferase involved in cellulose biosynthesis